MSLIRPRDMNKHFPVFEWKSLNPYAYQEWNIKSICWFHISVYTQVEEKTILHFLAHFSKGIPMFSGDHVMPKPPGSGSTNWKWKQKLVRESRTGGISWKIMKIIKTGKVSQILREKKFFTCLLFFLKDFSTHIISLKALVI